MTMVQTEEAATTAAATSNANNTDSRGGGTRVAGGRFIVPSNVVVERFYDGTIDQPKPTRDQSTTVEELLCQKGLLDDWKELCNEFIKHGRRQLEWKDYKVWSETKMVKILQKFNEKQRQQQQNGQDNDNNNQSSFERSNVKVSICVYYYDHDHHDTPNDADATDAAAATDRTFVTTIKGVRSPRWIWIEFIDMSDDSSQHYSSPYDVSDWNVVLNDWVIIPPPARLGNDGTATTVAVAVEQLSDMNTKAIKKKCPEDVQQLISSHYASLQQLYDRLTTEIYSDKKTRNWAGSWRTSKLLPLVAKYETEFMEHGIEISLCKLECEQLVYIKWIEFVDRTVVSPTEYWSVYDVDLKKRNRHIAEAAALSAAATALSTTTTASSFVSSSFASTRSNGSDNNTTSYVTLAKEPLVVNGMPNLLGKCPPTVQELLQRKGIELSDEYAKLDVAITSAKNMRNFVDLWRLTESGIVTFEPLADFKSSLQRKGIQVSLCESIGKNTKKNYWLEYADTEELPDYFSPYDICIDSVATQMVRLDPAAGGDTRLYKKVAGGRHLVPASGVAVEELTEFSKITDECPDDVHTMLTDHDLVSVYDDFINKLASTSSTRSWTDNWKGKEILHVMDDFVEAFQHKGIKLVLCKLKPDKGRSYRWFEYIDLDVVPTYVPQYDLHGFNDDESDEIELGYRTLKFPKGVAIEPLKDRKVLLEHIPTNVRTMLEKKDCYDLYVMLIDVMYGVGGEDIGDGFSEKQVTTITKLLAPKFEAKGIAIFYSVMVEEDPQGEETNRYYWLEFVDRDVQPNYYAQRGINVQHFPPEGISKEELIELAVQTTVQIATVAVAIALSGGEN